MSQITYNPFESSQEAQDKPAVTLAVTLAVTPAVTPAVMPAATPVVTMAPVARAIGQDLQEVIDKGATTVVVSATYESGARRSTRHTAAIERYIDPEHRTLLLEGEEIAAVLSDFEADEDAEYAMQPETDSDSDYEDE